MRINEIKDKTVNVTLDADELVLFTNLMYFYENHYEEIPNTKAPNELFHALNAQIILASNVCQYGHMDTFASSHYLAHKAAAYPKGKLAEIIKTDEAKKGGIIHDKNNSVF